MANPYDSAVNFQFWSRAMSWPAPGQIDPVTISSYIDPSENVATMGSCFAQHIARHLARSGCNYFVAEKAPANISQEEAEKRNYGIFSARYGNVYTVRQALQLFERAFGLFVPAENFWKKGVVFVDPFRPRIEPNGFPDIDTVRTTTVEHMKYVREVFIESKWLVFTLGLTEAWQNIEDGAIYPLAPGVAGGEFDPQRYRFINFTIDDVRMDLFAFVNRIRKVNPKCKIILTVSPVPLIATYEKRHVLVSTTYSKAVLRVAAEEVAQKESEVIYFPSYEIITSPASGGQYFADDLRQVTEQGVNHVMRLFSEHFLTAPRFLGAKANGNFNDFKSPESDVICDEEAIEYVRRQIK